jgi:outer membrane PBP1 activator LpoA protein
MNHSSDSSQSMADPFVRFWSDIMSQMTQGGARAASFGPPQDEVARQVRQAFFDAWAKHCEEIMRSEQFLEAMKKSMDNALAFREQINKFLVKTLRDYQMPSQDDTDSILLAVRRLEERVLKRVDEMSQRVEAIEEQLGDRAAATSGKTATAKGASR